MGRIPNWERLLKEGIHSLQDLKTRLSVPEGRLWEVVIRHPVRINSYYLSLIKDPKDPIGRQVIPTEQELEDSFGQEDPLLEEYYSPVPNLTHRYPDRVLFLVSNQCPIYCRFCNRRRKVGRVFVTKDTIEAGIKYIKENRTIREVLLSGGDPLMLREETLEHILRSLRSISHLEVIRIGTRVPSALPQRITKRLVALLKKFRPLFINIHFNHPKEITEQVERALEWLADSGIPLASQTVLLKGVNDELETLKELFLKLLRHRVRPYYLFQADMVKGTKHFWTHPLKGLELWKGLWGNISGMAVPHFAIDLPKGGGKVVLTPGYLKELTGSGILFENFEGKEVQVDRFWEEKSW